MRIGSCLALVGLVVMLTGCGGDGRDEAAPEGTARAIELDEDRFLGFLWPPRGAGELELAKLDPVTLAPTSRPVPLAVEVGVTELSPDGSILAFVEYDRPRIELFDLKRMRSLGTIELGTTGYVSRLSWPRPDALFAVVGQSTVVLADPGRREVVETWKVDGVLLGDAHEIPAGMLGLVAPADRIGPLKVVVFGGKGTSSVRLRGVVGGWESESGDDEADFRARGNQPGLAVDPTGRRALVVPSGGEVAEIDLANLRVTPHSLARPASLFERFHNWLEPPAEAKQIEGPIRHAVWLSSGFVAVTGADYTASGRAEAAGLSLIDTRDWSVRVLDERTDWIVLAQGRLLTFEPGCAGDGESLGLAAYDLEGNEELRLCRDEGFDPQVVGDYAYLGFDDNTRFEVVDLKSGTIVATPTTKKATTLVTTAVVGGA